MKEFFLVVIAIMIFVIIFQISKTSEYVSVLKGEEKSRKQNNKINAFLMVLFMVLGLAGVWYCNELYYGKTLFPQGSASLEGEEIDSMLMITIGVVFGLKFWFKITGDPPANHHVVEITGSQFKWDFRYPGKDKVLGKTNYKLYNNPVGNTLSVDFEDDKSWDDIRTTEMHLPVNKPVKLVIHAQDVIHNVGLSHFRMKMDAVPGIPTTMWFTPTITTAEMKKKTGNPNFVYEISCDQRLFPGERS
ncbi:MAG: hypothetical protein EOO06_11925 [Chitinophagaceae bacterium]|nr:MAG: hypothetical protein EOO06_11925 [Chitinophagaceae bacterium]